MSKITNKRMSSLPIDLIIRVLTPNLPKNSVSKNESIDIGELTKI